MMSTAAAAAVCGTRCLLSISGVISALPSCSRKKHPVGVDLSPYHKGIVGGDVNHVVKDDEGPAGSLPFTAVLSDDLI